MPWWVIVLAAIGAVTLIKWGLHLVGGLLGVLAVVALALVLGGVIRVPL